MAEALELPLASISRILKSTLPANVQVAKEVKQAFSKSAGLFVLYLTNTANQICQQSHKQTLTAEHIIAALEELEFDALIEPTHQFVKAYRRKHNKKSKDNEIDVEAEDEGSNQGKVKSKSMKGKKTGKPKPRPSSNKSKEPAQKRKRVSNASNDKKEEEKEEKEEDREERTNKRKERAEEREEKKGDTVANTNETNNGSKSTDVMEVEVPERNPREVRLSEGSSSTDAAEDAEKSVVVGSRD